MFYNSQKSDNLKQVQLNSDLSVTTTYFTKIYIEFNEEKLLIDMNTFDIVGKYGDKITVEIIKPNNGIYSLAHKMHHKKTEFTKSMSITCNHGNGKFVQLNLESDVSIDDMNNISLKINGLDIYSAIGGFISEQKLVKINDIRNVNF